jgi:aminomethyltransferase
MTRHSPLHDRHVALGAKFAAFGGWQMPLEYPGGAGQRGSAGGAGQRGSAGGAGQPVSAGGGVLREHAAVREAVGVFDVSHLGKLRVHGDGAVGFLNACLSNDLDKIGPLQAQYTLCLEDSGGAVDDLIAYRFSDDHVLLIPNAANASEVAARLAAAAPAGVSVTDEHDAYAVLAVQGPGSAAVVGELGLPADHDYMRFAVAAHGSVDVVVCRTGYTGEHGYEIVVPSDQAGVLWDALIGRDVRPCGLAARDTLRTEMGYALHGQDLSKDITPVQARLGWAVGWSKPAFWGRTALLAERAAGPSRLLWGLEATDRAIPRAHMSVWRGDDVIGEVTSGTFSPTKRVGIALALLDTSAGLGADDEVEVDVRGRRSRMRVVKPPFVTPSVRS